MPLQEVLENVLRKVLEKLFFVQCAVCVPDEAQTAPLAPKLVLAI